MSRQLASIAQVSYQNPHADKALILPMRLVCNSSDDERNRNIAYSASLDLPWLNRCDAHDKVAVICGGGPSLADFVDDIGGWKAAGATIFALNGASKFLRGYGICPDYQVIGDARQQTADLVDSEATAHLFASQVSSYTLRLAENITLWHMATEQDIEHLFPAERRESGGYSLIGGGSSVGNAAVCIAYVMGYRTFHLYGYDSSHREDSSHAYRQPMNDGIPIAVVEWGGKSYRTSITMKAQAEQFLVTGKNLIDLGCDLTLHGDGLLPAMWYTKTDDLTEKDKYRLMWAMDAYRTVSPGEYCVDDILRLLKPTGGIIDFGCGTGRASVALKKAGLFPVLVDFADNCRDEEAVNLPFLEWDLTKPLPIKSRNGLCCDVMEHIPTDDVPAVIQNIIRAADKVYFQISTVDDVMGVLIGAPLHLTVKPHEWWRLALSEEGEVIHEEKHDLHSIFIVERE